MTTASTTHAATVEFDHVTKVYGASAAKSGTPGAVNDLSLTVPAGKICVLVGPSGCGKTTSLKMVNRLIEPTSGRILLDGVDAATRNVTELRRGIGYVIQQTGLFPHQTIEENVATVPRLLGWSKARRHERAQELLALIGLDPAAYAGRYPAAALGRRAAARRRRAGAGRRPADHAHGRALRRRGPDRQGAAAERVPAAAGAARQDDPVRDPRHRRGDQDGRPRRGLPRGRGRRAVRPAVRDPGGPGLAVRRPVRRRGPRAQAAVPDPGQRPGAGTVRDGAGRRRRRGRAEAHAGRSVRVPAPPRRRRTAAGLGRPAPGPRGGGRSRPSSSRRPRRCSTGGPRSRTPCRSSSTATSRRASSSTATASTAG